MRIQELKNTNHDIETDKTGITQIVKEFYTNLYYTTNPAPYTIDHVNVINIGSEEI